MTPRRNLAVLSIWPGLPQIWAGRPVLGLALAATFTVLLNVALGTTFIWTDAAEMATVSVVWYATAVLWMGALGATVWWLCKKHPEHFHAEIDTLLREALQDYLLGHWRQAEVRLERILELDHRDSDALMHLASLYVHTGRTSDAREALRRCLELEEGSRKWKWEIKEEAALLGSA